MIKSFNCKDTEAIFDGRRCRRWQNVRKVVERKLQLLDSAVTLDALRSPPGNRLESLQGTRAGQHSVRVNDQWRICFVWSDSGVYGVEVVDYH